jgi:large subunit ribosomal protein L18
MRIKTSKDRRQRIKYRIRKRVEGTEARPRLTVFRSVAHIYVQVVDDMTGRTVASASTVEPTVKGAMDKQARGGNVAGAKAIGKTIAERRGVRPQRLPLSRARQGGGRRGSRSRSGVLTWD